MTEQPDRGDWSKLATYLRKVTECGAGIRPAHLEVTQEHVRAVTGSVQQGKFYKDHSQKDMVDHAQAAGYAIQALDNGNFVFTAANN